MKKKEYDFLIVGAGLFGATCAHLLKECGYKVLIVDKRKHVAGNCYTEREHGIMVHKYGAHIFHTSNKRVWEFVNQFATFNNYINSPVAIYHDELYNLPFNMNTFHQLWNVKTPKEAREKIDEETSSYKDINPRNLEEQALKLGGETIYKKLIKEYTEKQWGCECKALGPSIIKRLPFRFTYDNNYFNDRYQGIPEEGYTEMIKKMLIGVDVKLNYDFALDKLHPSFTYKKLIYTGSIDRLFNYMHGKLIYRSVKFKNKYLKNCENYQGNAVVNYTSHNVKYTRVIEHKHFEKLQSPSTIISFEYPYMTDAEHNPCYPISNYNELYEKYRSLCFENVYVGGRLGLYRYLDMDKTIEEAMKLVEKIVNE